MLMNMSRILGQTALGHSNRIALVNIERDRRFTYRQLHELTNRICHLIRRRFGLGEGDIFATLLENDNLSFFHPWLFKSAATAVWLDLRASREEQLLQIDHVRPRLIFMETADLELYLEPLQERGIPVVCMDQGAEQPPGVHFFWDLLEEMPSSDPDEEYEGMDVERHIAVLKFTGGTTGKPRCVTYSLWNLLSAGCNPIHYCEVLPFERPRALLSSPINHVATGQMLFPLIFRGGTVVTSNRADIETMGRIVEREKIDFIYTIPTVLYRILDSGLHRRHDLRSLKTIRYGASPMSPAKLQELLDVFGRIFVQGYASTECWPPATVLLRSEHRTDSEEHVRRLASVGRPVPGVEVRICDDEGRELPSGQTGEIWIRGPHTVRGYYRDPEETRLNFSPRGFWKSGDLGRIDPEGYVYLVDRKKDLIVTGGFNVYAMEVENCLNRHPAVHCSAVVGVPDEEWGEAVCAAVVLKPGAALGPQGLIDHCKAHLARYKAPKRIDFVAELPLSPIGKILRREVRRQYLDRRRNAEGGMRKHKRHRLTAARERWAQGARHGRRQVSGVRHWGAQGARQDGHRA